MANNDNSVSNFDYYSPNAWQNSSTEFPEMSSNPSMFQCSTPVSTPISFGSPSLNISPGGYGDHQYNNSAVYVPNVNYGSPLQPFAGSTQNISPGGYDSFSYNNFAAYVPNQDCGLIFTPQPRMLLPDVFQQPPQIDFSQHIENQSQTVIGVQANSCGQPVVEFTQLKNPPPYSHQSTNISFAESTQTMSGVLPQANSCGQPVVKFYQLKKSHSYSHQSADISCSESTQAECPGSTQKNSSRKRVRVKEAAGSDKQCEEEVKQKEAKRESNRKSSENFRLRDKDRIMGLVQIVKNLEEMMCAERLMPVNPLMLAFFSSLRLNVNLLKSIAASNTGSRIKMKIDTMNHMLMECENSLNVLKNIISQM